MAATKTVIIETMQTQPLKGTESNKCLNKNKHAIKSAFVYKNILIENALNRSLK